MCHRKQPDAIRTGNDVHRCIAPGQYDVKKRLSFVQRCVTVGSAVICNDLVQLSGQVKARPRWRSGEEAMPPQIQSNAFMLNSLEHLRLVSVTSLHKQEADLCVCSAGLALHSKAGAAARLHPDGGRL